MRVFFAFDLNSELKEELASVQQQLLTWFADDLRYSKKDSLHLTLKFFGEVEEAECSRLKEAISLIAQSSDPFEVKLSRVGCFPERGAPRVIWSGLSNQSGVLTDCYNRSEDEFSKLGYEKEKRPFHPHITLARPKKNANPNDIRKMIERLEMKDLAQEISEVSLFQSILSNKAAHYEKIFSVSLK